MSALIPQSPEGFQLHRVSASVCGLRDAGDLHASCPITARYGPLHHRDKVPCRFHDSSALGPRRYAGPLARRLAVSFGGKWNRRKKNSKNNMLPASLDHNCVLFVQHPSENKLHWPVLKRSLVVCARTFGNCDRATEGGIPRSSRLGLSLKSLAFMRVCPKARCGLATGRRD